MNITSGGAPAGYEFHDVEEEYVVDPETGVGSWQRAKAAETAPLGAEAAGATGAEATATGDSGQAAALAKGKPGPKPKAPKPKKPKVSIPDEPL